MTQLATLNLSISANVCSLGTFISGSSNVFANGSSVIRVGDLVSYASLLSSGCTSPGTAKIVTGASNVFINGRQAAIIGSLDSDNGSIVTGSHNVLAR